MPAQKVARIADVWGCDIERLPCNGPNGEGKRCWIRIVRCDPEAKPGGALPASDFTPSCLRDFELRKDESVQAAVACWSEVGTARMSLVCLAVRSPRLLIPDELTNNLDRATHTHPIEVLRHYPGAML